MHHSVGEFLKRAILPHEVVGRVVVDVGSLYVNGTAKDFVTPLEPERYVGVDVRNGPCVDVICDATELTNVFPIKSVGAVICVSTLEHVRDWKIAVLRMKQILQTHGFIYLTVPSPGFQYHPEPDDYWRFVWEHVRLIFSDFEIFNLERDPQAPGIFLKARKPEGWLAFTELPVDVCRTVEPPL